VHIRASCGNLVVFAEEIATAATDCYCLPQDRTKRLQGLKPLVPGAAIVAAKAATPRCFIRTTVAGNTCPATIHRFSSPTHPRTSF